MVGPRSWAMAAMFLATLGSQSRAQGGSAPRIPELGVLGSGRDTVLILPCMGCRWTVWESFMRANGDRYTFIAVTPPGFGGTAAPALTLRDSADTPWRRNLLDALDRVIAQHRIRRALILGHSWGTMVAVQLAARRPDLARGIIALDGSLESTTWLPPGMDTRITAANSLRANYVALDTGAEAWSAFNRFQIPPDSAIARPRVRDLMLLHGMFTATSRDAIFGYWRENFLIDITELTKSLTIPVLDVKLIWPSTSADSVRSAHAGTLEQAGISRSVRTLFMPNTIHHVMVHRPNELAAILDEFARTLPR